MVFTQEGPTTEEKNSPRLVPLKSLLTDWAIESTAAHEAFKSGKPRGPVTGLPKLDHELGGALSPGKHLLHGGPGVGKTALGLQVAATAGCPALYVTCEMAPLELLRRIIARETGIYLGRLRSGELTPQAAKDLAEQAVTKLPNFYLVDATLSYADPTIIRGMAALIRGDGRDVLIVVDSIHSWVDSAPGADGEYDRLGAGLGALGTIANALTCPVLILAERNRASMKVGGLSAGAGSRKLEYGAESVWDLNVKEDADTTPNGETPVTLTLAKNRQGTPNRRIDLLFHGARQRFREAEA